MIIKTNNFDMRRLIFLLIAACSVTFCFAQLSAEKLEKAEKEVTDAKKLKKEKEKQLEALRDSINFHNAVIGINEMNFVVEADRISFPNGVTVNTDSNTNFISATNGKGMVQIAFPQYGFGGFNGLGGITVEGMITNIKTSTDKKGNVILKMSVMGTGISAQILITLLKTSNEVVATIDPNFNSNRLTVYGKLYPNQLSSVFKAMPL